MRLLELPRFARGFTSPFGKMAPAIGYLRLPHETDAALRKGAAARGMTPLEYARELVVLGVHGRSEIERRYSLRLDLIEQALPNRDIATTQE